MDAKDLMIGDHVAHFYDGRNCVVTELREHIIAVSFIDTDYKTKYSGIMPEMAFEPIPLTAEILEKNGFVKLWNNNWQFNDYHSIIISEDFYIAIFELSTRLDYVHELQHALRLCNIEKEIEL